MKKLRLTMGKYALVDDEDFEWLNQWRWFTSVKTSGTCYARRSLTSEEQKQYGLGINVLMHRFILKAPKEMAVDHINGNGLDNRRSNLRLGSKSQNQWNRGTGKNNTSGFKGVGWHKGDSSWQARIKVNGKTLFLGTFPTKLEAAIAYNEGAKKYHGEFARLNPIPGRPLSRTNPKQ